MAETSSSYQAPVFTHPEPRKAVEMPVLRSLQSVPPAAPLLDPVEVSWDGGGGDSIWETAANWSNDLVPDANSNVIIDATVTVQLNGTTTINGLVLVAQDGLNVYVFDGTTYTTYNGVTDASGEVVFTLPHGDYRFRADLSGTQFWSGEVNHCTLPGCETTSVTVAKPVVVTVTDTDLTPKEGLSAYAFDGENYTGFTGTTDASGEVSFILPDGNYRFRADLNGTQFWSGAANHCTVPGCEAVSVTVTKPVTVSVISQVGTAYPGLNVYAFDGEDYTGFNGVSDANGEVVFTLPEGDYRFRADLNEVQFWSGETDHCALPGCEAALVDIPGAFGITEVTIDYTYDPLYRLTAADYDDDDGPFFHYTYDAVGNRLTQDTLAGTNAYAYDVANQLTSVDGVSYTWDNNGNLLTDGTSVYTYNYANMLASVNQNGAVFDYLYSGLGDRLQQTIDGVPTSYTLDINAGLTQVVADGTHTYLYGQGRIAQEGAVVEYFLGDALNSVRQLVDGSVEVILYQSYEPFGNVLNSDGVGVSVYQFSGETRDLSGLLYLRARYLDMSAGRLLTRDSWQGSMNRPLSFNKWNYAIANPVRYTDPSGNICLDPWAPAGFHLNLSRGCDYNEGSWMDRIRQMIGRRSSCPTETVLPTPMIFSVTYTPTISPTQTLTPNPSHTPSLTPTPTVTLVPNVYDVVSRTERVFYELFDNKDAWYWRDGDFDVQDAIAIAVYWEYLSSKPHFTDLGMLEAYSRHYRVNCPGGCSISQADGTPDNALVNRMTHDQAWWGIDGNPIRLGQVIAKDLSGSDAMNIAHKIINPSINPAWSRWDNNRPWTWFNKTGNTPGDLLKMMDNYTNLGRPNYWENSIWATDGDFAVMTPAQVKYWCPGLSCAGP